MLLEHPSMHILSLERTPIADPWRARACIESCTELPQVRFTENVRTMISVPLVE